LAEVKRHREVTRAKRSKNNTPVAAIVGYTNAGKSTLLNTLTDAGVLQEDKLFATLDPTTRALELTGGAQVLLTDTVGFIRKLPHHLIEAFRSTLEEAKYADIILHVVDASNPQMEQQMYVVYETLKNLGVTDKTVITLFNKQDRITEPENLRDFHADYVLKISAKMGDGLDDLKLLLEKLIQERSVLIERVYPYDKAGLIQLIRKHGQLIEEEYRAEGIYVKAYVPMELYGTVG
jgi:GTP-binding protein HflX